MINSAKISKNTHRKQIYAQIIDEQGKLIKIW